MWRRPVAENVENSWWSCHVLSWKNLTDICYRIRNVRSLNFFCGFWWWCVMLREDRNEICWWKNSHLRSHVCQTWVNIKQYETKQWKPNRIDSEKPSYVKLRKRSSIWRAPIRWWPFFVDDLFDLGISYEDPCVPRYALVLAGTLKASGLKHTLLTPTDKR